MNIKKNHCATTLFRTKLALEATAIIYNLIVAYNGNEYLLADKKTVSSFLYSLSVVLTPWLIVMMASPSSCRLHFYQWKKMDSASFQILQGWRARIKYLLRECRLPIISLLYIGHLTLATVSINALSGPRVNYWKDYTSNLFFLVDIVYPIGSICLLFMIAMLAKSSTPLALMKKMGHSSEAAFYRYTHGSPKTNYFLKWIRGIVRNLTKK
jgi:hypothetical protein